MSHQWMTARRAEVLGVLCKHSGDDPEFLAMCLGLSYGTLKGYIRDFKARGLVYTHQDQHYEVWPTEKARAAIRRATGCWLWTGRLNDAGYGMIKLGRKEFRASRVMLLLDGRNPEGKLALHRCDNPACVNPAHLFLGTHEDNMADCKQKGRCVHQVYPGESNPKAKLSAAQVQEIRRSRDSYKDLAARFGMTKENIGAIKNGKTWKCLPWT